MKATKSPYLLNVSVDGVILRKCIERGKEKFNTLRDYQY
jgi:hypothetical protein